MNNNLMKILELNYEMNNKAKKKTNLKIFFIVLIFLSYCNKFKIFQSAR